MSAFKYRGSRGAKINVSSILENANSHPHLHDVDEKIESKPTQQKPGSQTVSVPVPLEYSNRFRSTLLEACEKLELLGLITNDSLRRRKDINNDSNVVNNNNNSTQQRTRKDIFLSMQKQRELEFSFKQLQDTRNTLRGLANKSKYQQNQIELKQLTQQLKDSTTNININLRDHPTIVGNLQKIQRERSSLQSLLNLTINELNNGFFSQIINYTNDRSGEQRLLNDTKLRTEKTQAALQQLKNELDNENNEFERLDEIKNNQINQLTAELKHLKKVTQLTSKYEQQTAIAESETIARIRENQLNSLQEQINQAKLLHKTDKRVNKRTITFLTGQKEAADKLHSEWESKYDMDHNEITREYENVTNKRNNDQVKLIQYQQRWQIDKQNKIYLINEAKKRAEEEQKQQELDFKRYLAACKIQFHWRVYWRKRKIQLKKLKKKRNAKLRAQQKADTNPLVAMANRQAEADARKAEQLARQQQSAPTT